MQLSPNEAKALISRACEAILPKNHDYAALAELVLWMECRELPGIQALIHSDIDGDRADTRFLPDNITENGAEFLCDDAAFIRNLTQIADFLNWKSSVHSKFTLDCGENETAVSGQAVQSLLAVLKGHVMAVWGHAGVKYMVLKGPNDPEIELWTASGHDHISSLAIRVYEDERDFLEDRGGWILEHDNLKNVISTGQLARRARAAMLNNLEISDNAYESICKIADRILVEASEASRKGAGD